MATKRLNNTNEKLTAKWQYLGETDPADYIWSNKTHRSASDAFRDADYATALWRCETEWDRSVEIIKMLFSFILAGFFMWVFISGVMKCLG